MESWRNPNHFPPLSPLAAESRRAEATEERDPELNPPQARQGEVGIPKKEHFKPNPAPSRHAELLVPSCTKARARHIPIPGFLQLFLPLFFLFLKVCSLEGFVWFFSEAAPGIQHRSPAQRGVFPPCPVQE